MTQLDKMLFDVYKATVDDSTDFSFHWCSSKAEYEELQSTYEEGKFFTKYRFQRGILTDFHLCMAL